MASTAIRSKHGVLILTVTILVSGLGFLMNSAVTIALPAIQEAFDSGIAEVQWIANTYILALGSLILLSGVIISAETREAVEAARRQSFFAAFRWAMGILGGSALIAGMVSLFGLQKRDDNEE